MRCSVLSSLVTMTNKTKKQGRCSKIFQVCKPYAAMTTLQFGYAGMNILTKFSLSNGLSHNVLVVYRHAFATLSIAPFALILEWNSRPRMTFAIFMQIFLLALLGPVIDQNFYYAGLKLTSPTFACALSNMLPAMTFVLAVVFRMEKLDMRRVRCQAKVIGTVVAVAGAMLMTLYKGPIMKMVWTKYMHVHGHQSNAEDATSKDWLWGCIFVIIATLAWASFFVLQTVVLERYAPLSLTTLVCFVGTLQAIAVTFVMEHKLSVWRIGWDMNLLACAYAGIVTSSIAYYVQGLVIQDKGPVFASAFSPLMMVIVAIMGSFILAENIYLGGIIGAILIVVGLYSVLWGKHKENREKEEMETMEIPVAIKGTEANISQAMELVEVEQEKTKANNKAITTTDEALVKVTVPVSEA
ncbi:WAT1-related protein [Canna indica]|uniref:WAT1-related protein n=1 Tax=Canna indica TaxID=4628 RepID=A0AAQ3KPC3_9LILI|nr:WAT1-related protein [Canna indica]